MQAPLAGSGDLEGAEAARARRGAVRGVRLLHCRRTSAPEFDRSSPAILARVPAAVREEAAARVTESGAIAGARFTYRKGEEIFELHAGGLWSGIPWWQGSSRSRSFWRNSHYFPHGDPQALPATAPPAVARGPAR